MQRKASPGKKATQCKYKELPPWPRSAVPGRTTRASDLLLILLKKVEEERALKERRKKSRVTRQTAGPLPGEQPSYLSLPLLFSPTLSGLRIEPRLLFHTESPTLNHRDQIRSLNFAHLKGPCFKWGSFSFPRATATY